MFNPKYVFTIGFGVLGCFSLGSGFVKDDQKIGLLVLRALTGICEPSSSLDHGCADTKHDSRRIHNPFRVEPDRVYLA